MRRVMLFSGGMDSVAAWYLLDKPARVYVCIGSRYEPREVESLMRHHFTTKSMDAGRDTIIDCGDWLGDREDRDGRVPMRNLLFAVVAGAFRDFDEVVLGATAGETSPDKSRTFARAASLAMSTAEGRRITLSVPFRGVTKAGLVRKLIAHVGRDAAEFALRQCPACYMPELPPGVAGCGQCMSCVRRWTAMSLNGFQERYQVEPWRKPIARPASWWRYVVRTPVADWPGIARLNMELLRARRLAGAR